MLIENDFFFQVLLGKTMSSLGGIKRNSIPVQPTAIQISSTSTTTPAGGPTSTFRMSAIVTVVVLVAAGTAVGIWAAMNGDSDTLIEAASGSGEMASGR